MVAIFQGVLMVSLGLRGPDSLPGSRGMLVLCLVPWVAVTALGYLMLLPASAVFVLLVTARALAPAFWTAFGLGIVTLAAAVAYAIILSTQENPNESPRIDDQPAQGNG